jgi:predicted metal-dependent HD superfamily phosphohydrolase
MQLQKIWRDTWSAITAKSAGDVSGDALFTAIMARYAEPHRHYHTQQHLQECMQHYEAAAHLTQRSHEVAVALWFHDAIYDTHAHNNEAASAQWATEALTAAGADTAVCVRVHELIMATQHRAVPTTPDACLLVDIDLSILGAPPIRFDQYETQIRSEYNFIEQAIFNEKRAAILRGFLARDKIYSTPLFNKTLEAQARENLTRSIRAIS